MATICVIGAGPAGSTFAARMAQLGHDVRIVERARFPRSHLGESLSPGVLPLLETTGARQVVEAAGFPRVRGVWRKWGGELQLREDPHEQGMLVDRGEFDRLLLYRAQALGVRVSQPARVRECRSVGGRWTIDVEVLGAAEQLHADFLADASGRSSTNRRSRRRTGCRTIALYAYWHGRNLPRQPRIEAGADAWYWGVPLPDGLYNTLVFVDVNHFRASRAASLTQRFLELLGKSELLAGCENARLAGPVRVSDATPWLDEDSVTSSSIRLGEAALAIDPLSSSGVQKAIQSALAAAVVANTLLRKPAAAGAATRFYRSSLEQASVRHCRWAAEHYGTVAARTRGRFWEDRSAFAEQSPRPMAPRTPRDPADLSAIRVALSRQLEFVDLPCLDGDFVTVKSALRHPNLESPVIWVGRREVAPLLRRMGAPSTPLQLAMSWLDRVPLQSGIAIAGWLVNNGILVEESALSGEPAYASSPVSCILPER